MRFTSIGVSGLLIFIGIIIWIDRKKMRKILGYSIYWLYGAIIFGAFYLLNGIITTLQGYSFGLYDAHNTFVILRYYFFAIGVTVIIVVLVAHLEQSLSYLRKTQVSDIYSHDLGNVMQIILNYLESIDSIDEKDNPSIELIKSKCIEAGDIIKEIREIR
jgi:hypothetical protein